MEWLFKVLSWLKGGSNAAEFKAITSEYRYLYEIQKNRLKELEEIQKRQLDDEVREYLDREKEYHIQLIELIKENRDLKEENLFLKRMKNGKHK